jgi:hypothetical protein
MVKILGDPFDEYVHTQINQRQASLAKKQKSDDDIKVFNTSTPWIRLSSSIEVLKDRAEILAANLAVPVADIVGSALAKKLVLFAGTTDGKGGTQRGGVGYGFNNAYGFLSDPGQGYKPMPGIISISTTYKSNGSLKQAQVKLKCYTRKQFEALEAIYLRLGYTMILEYGHSVYFTNKGIKENMSSLQIPNVLFHQVKVDPEKVAQNAAAQVTGDQTAKDAAYYQAKQEADLKEAKAKAQYGASKIRLIFEDNKINTGGNYDALLAKVANFSWSLGNDLSYDITLDLVSIGDIIDSLKMNIGSTVVSNASENVKTPLGFQNIVNVRLQRSTGLFIQFLQKLTDQLDLPEVLATVSQPTQEAQKETDKATTISKEKAEYVPLYIAQIDAVKAKLIDPYYRIQGELLQAEISVVGIYSVFGATVIISDYSKFATASKIEDLMDQEGTTDLLPFLRGDINANIPTSVKPPGIFIGTSQTVLEYYGLDWESYEKTVTVGKTTESATFYRLRKKDTYSFDAHNTIRDSLEKVRSLVVKESNTRTGEENTENLTAALFKYKESPLKVLNFLLYEPYIPSSDIVTALNAADTIPELSEYQKEFEPESGRLGNHVKWILQNKVNWGN